MNLQKKLKIMFSINLWFFFFFQGTSYSVQEYKEIEIRGLIIHSEQYLIKYLNIRNLPKGKKHFESIANKLNKFYHEGGYTIAKTYLIEETSDKLKIFMDEGRLGRIVFLKLTNIQTLWVKYEFKLKDKIYNKYTVQKEIKRLEEEFGFAKITELLQHAKDYNSATFQLDDEFYLPGLGRTSIPFFEKFGYRYNLLLHFGSKSKLKMKKNTVKFSLRTNSSKGLIPRIDYYHPSLTQDNDLFLIGSSIGIMYGYWGGYNPTDLDFKRKPEWRFMEVHSNYHFKPTFKEYFTPFISMSVYNSHEGRMDLGLSKYKFLQMRGILAPGITFLNQLKINVSIGGERVYILDPVVAEDAENYAQIERDVDNWIFIGTRLVDRLLWMPGKKIKKRIELIYNYYINHQNFHKIIIKGKAEFELKNLSIYSLAIDFNKSWDRPPFYHETAVFSGSNFKGCRGSYHTRRILRNANEYQISIYKAFVYGGIFTDLAWFEGFDREEEDLSGDQYGIVSGISGHIIFLDQFEFRIYYGKDYIYPVGISQFNLHMKLRKKW